MDEKIIRPATETEKKDYVELGKELTIEQKFKKLVDAKEAECTRKHIPFCRNWAWDDFNDKKSEIYKNAERNYGAEAAMVIKLEDFRIDLEKYCDLKNFVLLDEAEVEEMKLMDGVRTAVKTGKYMNFQAKGKKYRISVFVPK
jgi:hypothetical protein